MKMWSGKDLKNWKRKKKKVMKENNFGIVGAIGGLVVVALDFTLNGNFYSVLVGTLAS